MGCIFLCVVPAGSVSALATRPLTRGARRGRPSRGWRPPAGVGLVDCARPRPGRPRATCRTARAGAPGARGVRRRRPREPDLGQQGADALPTAVGQQQVVALGDHEPRGRRDRDGRRDRLLEVALEAGDEERAVGFVVQAPQRGDVAVDVEGVRCALAVAPAEPVELDVGEVEAVHRQVADGVRAEVGHAGARAAARSAWTCRRPGAPVMPSTTRPGRSSRPPPGRPAHGARSGTYRVP